MSDVCVVGAGVAGLVAALRLQEAGHTVTVYERWPGLGGQAATLDVGDDVLVERYYHHWFTGDRHIVELMEELGLGDTIEWVRSSVAFFVEGRMYPFTTPLDLLRFSPLSVRSRLRMGLRVLRLQRSDDPLEAFERETAREWVRREMGEEAYARVWGPLLRAKFGDRADEISMAWLWGKLTMRRRLQGKEARTEMLGYPRDSFEPLFVALQQAIERRGGRVLIDSPVKLVERDVDGAFQVTAGAPDSFRRGHDPSRFEVAGPPVRYDAVVATVPNDIFLAMLSSELRVALGPRYLGQLESIEYHTALCLLLEVDRQVTPYYWTNVVDADMPFIGLIEQTNLVRPELYQGRRFLYVANYVERGDPLLDLDADALLAHYEPGLKRVAPSWSRSWVRQRWRFVEPSGQPVVTVGYQDRIPTMLTPVEGLLLANTTQIYPEDRGTNYSVRLGQAVAELVPFVTAGTRRF